MIMTLISLKYPFISVELFSSNQLCSKHILVRKTVFDFSVPYS